MIERGSNKHGPHIDDEMKHEIDGVLKGGRPAHVEEWRQTEPFPDDTDDEEVQAAMEQGVPPAEGTSGGTSEGEESGD